MPATRENRASRGEWVSFESQTTRNFRKRLISRGMAVAERIRLESSVENTWPGCSYPESTMHSGSQLTCSNLCPKISHLNEPSGRPFIESEHNFRELACQQDERAPQYEGDTIE
jgi:hypothetical protein